MALIASLGAAPGVAAAAGGKPHAPAVQKVAVIPHTVYAPPRKAAPRGPGGVATATAWPSAGSATVDVSKTTASPSAAVRAGSLPVSVRRMVAGTGPAEVDVSVLDHAAAVRAGVPGVVFTLDSATAESGGVSLDVDYSSFRHAGGADFGDRLRLVQLPACALTTPQLPSCQVQTPLASTNDAKASKLSAQVQVDARAFSVAHPSAAAAQGRSAAASPTVLAAVAGASSSNGDFTATSLSPSGTWSSGGASGNFTWSYPVSVPSPAAGAAPTVALNYDSSSVDGRIATTNNQFGPVGEGFTLSSSFIERSYADCADDPEGAISGKYDQCWAGQVVTLNLDGKSTPLVLDAKNGWHEQQDSGDRVQYLTGSSTDTANGTYDNGYWVVTTTDGTQYYFGKNRGPGWASGDASTNSAWTEPVYGAHVGDPCYSSTGFSASSCSQGWRWNLDFVVDPHGNAAAYYYAAETNFYGANNATTGVSYIRGGYPTRIDYGLREENGTIYAKPAPQQVVFTPAERCIADTSFSCDPSQFTTGNAAKWPDTPQDQQCLSGATCNNHAPTFWSTKRITDIITQYSNGSGYTKVDEYALGQGFSTAGDDELLLNSITRTGYTASGSKLSLPAVSFTYQLMDNRVPNYNSEPSMAHWRLTNVTTETGETISVTYSSSCTTTAIPSSPSVNTGLCYPVYWAPPFNKNQILDYFNKYVVGQVEVQDGTAGSPTELTTYSYVGGAGWHYDDNELVKATNRTYGQFRGYGEVDTLSGDPNHTTNGVADVQTLTTTLYYRGMNGDTLPNGATRSVTLRDSLGETVADDVNFADQPFETRTFAGPGGAQLTDQVSNLANVATTATRSRTGAGLPDLRAVITRTSETRDYTNHAAGGTDVTDVKTTYDSDGRAVLADNSGTSIPETCTQTAYADNSAAWIRNKTSETIVAKQACPSTVGSLTATAILADTRTYYDGSTTLGSLTGAGDATEVDKATANNAGTLTFTKQSTAAYDAMGRATSGTDALGHTGSTAYTPSDGGPLTATTTTNAKSQTSSVTLDPGRGTTLKSVDVAGYVTSESYDALGRVTGVWKPGRTQGSSGANITYAYQVLPSTPLAVTTNTLIDTGTSTSYRTSISLYDSLGHLRQVQVAAEGGVTVETDTLYDSHGWVWQQHNKYVISGSPSTTLNSVADSAVSDRTVNTLDAAGRTILQSNYNGNTLTSTTQTVYGGDRVTVIKRDASGTLVDTPATTVSDVRGYTVEKDQYTAPPTVSGSVVAGVAVQATKTTYDALGRETQIQDPAGGTWSYGYDMAGNQTSATDPDTGTTTRTYDAAGNLTSTTDARGTSNNYVYDSLNRKTAEYTGSTTPGSGTKVATWIWDSLAPGKLSYETSITSSGTLMSGNLGYDTYGNVNGTWVTVPSSQTGLGGTYKTQYTYSSTGLMTTSTPANGGGLPVDSLSYTYDQYGNATGESGYDVYASAAIYTPYDEISQITLGTGPSTAWLTYGYDAQTRRTTEVSLSDRQPSPQVDDTKYTYNANQEVTKVVDTQGATGTAPVDTQCYTYDALNRLNQAWSATDGCAANPASAGNSTVGGPQAFWQSWTFDQLGDRLSQTDHAVAGSTAGDVTTVYTYGVAGHDHAVASTTATNSATGAKTTNSYGYDTAGNTITRGLSTSGETLTWNQDGKLATDSKAASATSFVYDADGNQVLRNDPGSSTLYLPGEQITYTSATATTSGMRYYSFAGKTIGQANGSILYWTEGDLHGTMTVALDAFSQTSVIRRATTPYGAPRGAAVGTWPDDRSFLGDPTESATGLVDIGARKYDPKLGAFISVDPKLDTSAPQSMAGYAYAGDNPILNLDASGQSWWSAVTSVVHKVASVTSYVAPVLDVVAVATAAVPGLDVVTAGAAVAVNTINKVATVADGVISVVNDVREGKSVLDTGLDVLNTVVSAQGLKGASGEAGTTAMSAVERKASKDGEADVVAASSASTDSFTITTHTVDQASSWDVTSIPGNQDKLTPDGDFYLPTRDPLGDLQKKVGDAESDASAIDGAVQQLPKVGHPHVTFPKSPDFNIQHPNNEPVSAILVGAATVVKVAVQTYRWLRDKFF
jgi:RHS repeat-associated protein